MAVTKKYLKTKPVCKVTFKAVNSVVKDAASVHLVGDFNDWDKDATPMTKLKGGGFSLTVDLPVGQEYQYRFLIDGERWENDWDAEKYAFNPYANADNSVVVV